MSQLEQQQEQKDSQSKCLILDFDEYQNTYETFKAAGVKIGDEIFSCIKRYDELKNEKNLTLKIIGERKLESDQSLFIFDRVNRLLEKLNILRIEFFIPKETCLYLYEIPYLVTHYKPYGEVTECQSFNYEKFKSGDLSFGDIDVEEIASRFFGEKLAEPLTYYDEVVCTGYLFYPCTFL